MKVVKFRAGVCCLGSFSGVVPFRFFSLCFPVDVVCCFASPPIASSVFVRLCGFFLPHLGPRHLLFLIGRLVLDPGLDLFNVIFRCSWGTLEGFMLTLLSFVCTINHSI